MPIGDLVRGTLFVGCVGLVYALAMRFLVRSMVRRRRGEQPPAAERWPRRIVFTLAVAGLACFAYAYFVEPYRVEVTPVRLISRKLRPGTSLRIVHISDLHSEKTGRLEARAPDLIAAEKPDLIVFTGDTINSVAGLPTARRMFARLTAIAPVYAVRGNWDQFNALAGTTVRNLEHGVAEVEVNGNRVRMVGAATENAAVIAPLLQSLPADEFLVLLYHRPDLIERVAPLGKVDLYCAGHTHGGQVALPLYGAIVTLSQFGKKYESGLHRVQDTYLYVNRGLGLEGGGMPRVRFWARPEITVIDVTSSN